MDEFSIWFKAVTYLLLGATIVYALSPFDEYQELLIRDFSYESFLVGFTVGLILGIVIVLSNLRRIVRWLAARYAKRHSTP
jgi:uncharacterized membrane protein